jgi:PhzF family phenazine biosynthesis protein
MELFKVKSINVYHYDAFSSKPNKGNPAGIVFNGECLTVEQMQRIARKVGFNETAFPMKSDKADVKIRYFTPGHEVDLCGHATIAAFYALNQKGMLEDKTTFTLETRAGILPITISKGNEETYITMSQNAPQFVEFQGSKEELAKSIGLNREDIHDEFPILCGSTGAWTLLIPICRLESFKRMKPHNRLFPIILAEMPHVSIHPFCLETYDPKANMHARHFSSPFSGTVEDAVTGTASGVMGAYYAKYIKGSFEKRLTLVVEQGQEMGKDGRVMVEVTRIKKNLQIKILGNAVYVKRFDIVL